MKHATRVVWVWIGVVVWCVAGMVILESCGTVVDPRAIIPPRPVVVWIDDRTGCEFYRVGASYEYLMPVPDGKGRQLCREVPLPPKPPVGQTSYELP